MKITDALVAEHTIFLGVFDQIERVLPSLNSVAEIRTMAGIIEGMLRGHASREKDLAYVALDHALAEHGALEQMHEEHEELDARLRKTHTARNSAEARRLLDASLRASREHFRREEQELFPLLERSLSSETLNELGRSWIERRTLNAVGT